MFQLHFHVAEQDPHVSGRVVVKLVVQVNLWVHVDESLVHLVLKASHLLLETKYFCASHHAPSLVFADLLVHVGAKCLGGRCPNHQVYGVPYRLLFMQNCTLDLVALTYSFCAKCTALSATLKLAERPPPDLLQVVILWPQLRYRVSHAH